jgi:hypothetical protein
MHSLPLDAFTIIWANNAGLEALTILLHAARLLAGAAFVGPDNLVIRLEQLTLLVIAALVDI